MGKTEAETSSLHEVKALEFELERVPIDKPAIFMQHQLRADEDELADSRPAEEATSSEFKSHTVELTQAGFRYQAPIYFGTGHNKGMMSFDTGTDYTTVTSDICSNCHTKIY